MEILSECDAGISRKEGGMTLAKLKSELEKLNGKSHTIRMW